MPEGRGEVRFDDDVQTIKPNAWIMRARTVPSQSNAHLVKSRLQLGGFRLRLRPRPVGRRAPWRTAIRRRRPKRKKAPSTNVQAPTSKVRTERRNTVDFDNMIMITRLES